MEKKRKILRRKLRLEFREGFARRISMRARPVRAARGASAAPDRAAQFGTLARIRPLDVESLRAVSSEVLELAIGRVNK